MEKKINQAFGYRAVQVCCSRGLYNVTSSNICTYFWHFDWFSYNPIPCGWRKEGVFVFNEEEVSLALVKGGREVVGLRLHHMLRQTVGRTEPAQRHVTFIWNIVGFKRHFDFQNICICCQHFPGDVDLQEVRHPVFRLLERQPCVTGVTNAVSFKWTVTGKK